MAYRESESSIPFKGIVAGIIAVVSLLLAYACITTVSADEYTIKQSAFNGSLTVWKTPGPKWQAFGAITTYKQTFQYSFSTSKDQGKETDQSINARFFEGGHGRISGTVQIILPTDDAHLLELHRQYKTQDGIEQKVIRPAVERAVYMSGSLMTSKESSAERRSELMHMIEDQIVNGVYRVTSAERKVPDPITGQERSVKTVELVMDPKSPNGIARQEESLAAYGIKTRNFNINNIKYDDDVEGQIKQQQQLAMKIQTAIASAREAEQRASTAEQEGKANAAKAKWDQEVIKARELTKAEQEKAIALTNAEKEKAVAELSKQAAEYTKQQQILLGEGEAKRAQLVMQANGALEMKLATYEKVNLAYAEQLGKQQWVPSIMIGDEKGGNAAANLMQLLQVKTARDLGLDMHMTAK